MLIAHDYSHVLYFPFKDPQKNVHTHRTTNIFRSSYLSAHVNVPNTIVIIIRCLRATRGCLFGHPPRKFEMSLVFMNNWRQINLRDLVRLFIPGLSIIHRKDPCMRGKGRQICSLILEYCKLDSDDCIFKNSNYKYYRGWRNWRHSLFFSRRCKENKLYSRINWITTCNMEDGC